MRHLTLIQGGRGSGPDPESAPTGSGFDVWLERAAPELRVSVAGWLAGYTSTGRARIAHDLSPVAATCLFDEQALCGALTVATPSVLAGAICQLLGLAGDPDVSVPALTPILGAAPSTRVRMHAAGALARLGGDDARRALVTALNDDPDDDVRARAARALGGLGGRRAASSLCAVLADPGAPGCVRGEAAEALGVMGMRSATPALIRALRDSDPDVCIGAATALGLIGELAAVPELERLASDDRVVRDLGTVGECAVAAITDIRQRALPERGLSVVPEEVDPVADGSPDPRELVDLPIELRRGVAVDLGGTAHLADVPQ
ncbi:MAG: HEAT repeat domain-containing protein [Solirubrobacteraceae bacterium]|nr:HEAT repeat domain-containing protein [Solirubrobacteraceae bacterium]